MTGNVAHASVTIQGTPEEAWHALTDPDEVRRWMVGTEVSTDWQVGSPITWRGEIGGRAYEDKGEVLEADPPRRLSVTHYSPLMGQADRPESYHTVTYTLERGAGTTTVTLEQDGNASPEQAQQFSSSWQSMLESLKATVESS